MTAAVTEAPAAGRAGADPQREGIVVVLSPAKRLDFQAPVPPALQPHLTEPVYADEAARLIRILARLPAPQVGRLMSLSPALAELNAARYARWTRRPDASATRPAALAFAGDVYAGLQASSFDAGQWRYACEHLVMLSGLYGLLRALDRIQPYRLEMGTALANPRGSDLYAWWGDRLARRLAASPARTIVNLASHEYARAMLRPPLDGRVVDCRFEQPAPGGGWRVVGLMAKRARGMMARHAIVRGVRRAEELQSFTDGGYRYEPAHSDDRTWVFRLRAAPGG